MDCTTAARLFEAYCQAATDHFEATEKLASLAGRHSDFAEADRMAKKAYTKCQAARLTLETHWAEHECRSVAAKSR